MPQRVFNRRQFLQSTAVAGAGLALSDYVVDAAESEALPYGILDVLDSDPTTGMSAAVVVGDVPLVHTAQFGRATHVRAAADPAAVAADNPQWIRKCLESAIGELEPALRGAGSDLAQVVKFNFYVAHSSACTIIQQWLKQQYAGRYQPAVSFVVNEVIDPNENRVVAVDAVAVRREKVEPGRVLRTNHAAVLPPTHKLYISGDAAQGLLMPVVGETLQSLEKCLQHCGLDWSHVVQLKTFLQPSRLAADVEREMATYFGSKPVPPMVFAEWQSSEKMPLETELIAAVPPELSNAGGDTVEYINPPHKPGNAVFTRIARVRSDRTIYISGLYGEPSDSDGEIRSILDRVKNLVERAGGDLKHLVKATYYVSDDVTSKRLGDVRPEYYDPKRPPAASKAKVVGTGREGKTITVDMIAVPKP